MNATSLLHRQRKLSINTCLNFFVFSICIHYYNQFSCAFLTADQISSIFWLIHSDLHEMRVSTAFEYISSMVASIEPVVLSTNNGLGSAGNLLSLEQNFCKAKFHVRLKRRNGRVKLLVSSSLPPFVIVPLC